MQHPTDRPEGRRHQPDAHAPESMDTTRKKAGVTSAFSAATTEGNYSGEETRHAPEGPGPDASRRNNMMRVRSDSPDQDHGREERDII